MSNLIHVDIFDLLWLDAEIVQSLPLGAVVEADHELRQSSPEGHAVMIAEGLPQGVGPVMSHQLYRT